MYLATYRKAPNEVLQVAVKVITADNFHFGDICREIKLISKCVHHKNVVEYIGNYCPHQRTIHIVMEYLPGGDLHRYLIDDRNGMTLDRALKYLLQVCRAMEFLVHKHVIHRDLAARNCMWVGYVGLLALID